MIGRSRKHRTHSQDVQNERAVRRQYNIQGPVYFERRVESRVAPVYLVTGIGLAIAGAYALGLGTAMGVGGIVLLVTGAMIWALWLRNLLSPGGTNTPISVVGGTLVAIGGALSVAAEGPPAAVPPAVTVVGPPTPEGGSRVETGSQDQRPSVTPVGSTAVETIEDNVEVVPPGTIGRSVKNARSLPEPDALKGSSTVKPCASPTGLTEVQLVVRDSTHAKRSMTVPVSGAISTTSEFVETILDCKKWPMMASYVGVRSLEECTELDRHPDGSTLLYQRTGTAMGVASRHSVLRYYVAKLTDSMAEVRWDLVYHKLDEGRYQGPYSCTLEKHPEAVYTPYNAGTWIFDRRAGTVVYRIARDPGGSIPGFMETDSAIMAFPKELLRTRWGIMPE